MDEKLLIREMFQVVTESHQIRNLMSDVSTVTESSTVACQRRWCGSPAVQEAAMLYQKKLRRILLIAVLGLSVGGCVAYPDGGDGYYNSEVYTSPAPAYYAGGAYYSNGGGYYSPPARYYVPPARYYQPTPRYYPQPRVYQPAPRYYPARADYRAYENHGWDGRNRGNWDNDHRGGGRDHNHDDRGDRNGRGNHDGRGDHR